ncbi:transcriptional regulator, GntR family [Fontibacillus panacisegetis]|uniref:Transcriptional regulator, GntR family n=1 Tax=Fontibacillus panacisegetis TaxID=670482 RepID=A0A1G7GU57_9BACL|nr:GntR family transcriptional regulator [Fontibacillus panacisegetis]SDE91479.1 transcriptional regulator, GntR family [Fontibacillus panacisegetis]
MNHKELLLKIDPNMTFSVNTQIKEQLKWMIGTGEIESGDMLPAASQLANELGLNRNTINWVYNQLRDEGIVSMHKGRGTIVCNSPEVEQLKRERVPMLRLLTDTIHHAQSEGIELHDFFIAGLAYVLQHNTGTTKAQRIVFVECKEHDHPFYVKEIERITGCEILPLFLEDLSSGEVNLADVLVPSDIVVTTLNHADQVKMLVSQYDHKVHVIGATVEPSALIHMARLNAEASVAFICLGKSGGEWMASRVEEAGIHLKQANTVGLYGADKELVASILEQSDQIYASSAVFPAVKQMLPDKVELYPMHLEKSSENLLKEITREQ